MMSGAVAVYLIWPFVLVGIVWALAVWAINQPDNQSLVVQRLTDLHRYNAPALKSSYEQTCADLDDADTGAQRLLSGEQSQKL